MKIYRIYWVDKKGENCFDVVEASNPGIAINRALRGKSLPDDFTVHVQFVGKEPTLEEMNQKT